MESKTPGCRGFHKINSHAGVKENFLDNTPKLDLNVFHSHLPGTRSIRDSYFINL